MLPMPQASMRIIRTSIMPVQPSMKVLRAFLKVPDLADHAHDDGGDGGQNEGGIQRTQELPL